MNTHHNRLLARLRFRHLQLLTEVDQRGSLSRAAVALNLTQPALSKALKEIEDMTGFAAFHRGPRGLQKTTQGAVLVAGASLLLKELLHIQSEALASNADRQLAALLRLGTSAFLAVGMLPPIVARLAAMRPGLAVRLKEDNVPRLFEALHAGDLDALVTLYNSDVMASDAGRHVRFEKLAEERYVIIAPSGHRTRQGRAASWQTLASEPWVLTVKPSLARVFVEDTFRQQGIVPPTPVCETDGPVTAGRLVAAGIGLSSVPESTANDLVRERLVKLVKAEGRQPTATLGLVYRYASAGHPRITALRAALGLPGLTELGIGG